MANPENLINYKPQEIVLGVPSWVKLALKDSFHDVFINTGGLGSGKTTGTGLGFLYNMIVENPSVPYWWAIAPTHTKCEDVLLPSIVFVLQHFFKWSPDFHYKIYKGKPHKIYFFKTKQTLYLHSGDRPELMIGSTIGGFWITEGATVTREVFTRAQERARDKRAKRIIAWVEGVFEGEGWYADEFNFIGSDKERKYRRFVLHTDDNLHNLAPNYIQILERAHAHDPVRLKSYRYGLYTPFKQGTAFTQYIESRNVREVKPSPYLDIHLCYDFNYTPLCWSAWQVQQAELRGRRISQECCVEESDLNQKGLFESAVHFGLKFPPEIYHETPIYIWGDRTGHAKSHKVQGSDFENLRKYLQQSYKNVIIKAPRGVTPVRGRVEVCNKLFLYERAVIAPHCVNTRRSFNQTSWNKAGDDLEKKAGETLTHHSDGAGYRLYELYRGSDFESLTAAAPVAGVNWA